MKKGLVFILGFLFLISFSGLFVGAYSVEEPSDENIEINDSFYDFVMGFIGIDNDTLSEGVIANTDLSASKEVTDESEVEKELGIETLGKVQKVIEVKQTSEGARTEEVVKDSSNSAEEDDLVNLPNLPDTPGKGLEKKSWWDRILEFFRFKSTGNSILTGMAIDTPSWSFDGTTFEDPINLGNFAWSASFTEAMGNKYFNLNLKSNMKVNGATNAIIFKRGYYLDNVENKWESFDFEGVSVGSTSWLRRNVEASVEIPDVGEDDFSVFLAYSCLKVDGDWDCNEGKWVIFVVETGDIYYHGEIGEVPPMEYSEIKDLNLNDLPSVLEQAGVEIKDFQPILHDSGLVAPVTDFEVNVGQIQKFDFSITNLGNANLTSLNFELDVGEQTTAEIVEVNIPNFIAVNDVIQGSFSLLLKKEGSFEFPLFLKAEQEEVDTSDNVVRFNVVVGGTPVSKVPQDSLFEDWNREINFAVKEPFSITKYEDSSLSVMSGTDLVRTVFGGYRGGKSINPTMRVSFKPDIDEKSIFSTPYISSFVADGKMLTGDREVVGYYLEITNVETGEKYNTPEMESEFKYYYEPKELIPNFEFCKDYSVKVFLTKKTSETVDVLESDNFNVCGFEKVLPEFKVGFTNKLDGKYVIVKGGFDPKYFEDANVKYKVVFTDPKDVTKTYETSEINSADGFAMFKLDEVFGSRDIRFSEEEIFPWRIVLIDEPATRGGIDVNFDTTQLEELIHTSLKVVTEGNLKVYYDETAFSNPVNLISEGVYTLSALNDQTVKEIFQGNYLEKYGGFYFVSDKPIDDIISNDLVTREESVVNDALHFVWHGWGVSLDLTGEIEFKDDYVFKMRKGEPQVTSSEARSWAPVTYADIVFDTPYVNGQHIYSREFRDKIMDETGFRYSLTDLDTNEVVYDLIYMGRELKLCGYGFCLREAVKIKELPELKNGHIYEVSLKVINDNADLFVNLPENSRLFYLDGFQFIANNPLFRTRFYGLPFAPASVYSRYNEGVPVMNVYYKSKNLFSNEKGYIDKMDTTKREIKLTSFGEPFDKRFSNDFDTIYSSYFYYDKPFYLDEGEIMGPLFGSLSLIITPLKTNDGELDYLNNFNCKIGDFNTICKRTEHGYTLYYIDEDYNFMYNLRLNGLKYDFLERYRDNPQKYDAVIYDILSEIKRNPIKNFDLNFAFDRESLVQKPKKSFGFYQLTPSIDSHDKVDQCISPEVDLQRFSSFGDYPIGEEVLVEILTTPDKMASEGAVVKNIVISETFVGENSTSKDVLSWLDGLEILEDGENYRIRVTPFDGNFDSNVVSFPIPFVYKSNYINDLFVNYKDYLRKIPELSSTLFAPFEAYSEKLSGVNYCETKSQIGSYSIIRLSGGWIGSITRGISLSAHNHRFYWSFPFSSIPPKINDVPLDFDSHFGGQAPSFSALFSVNPSGTVPFDDSEWTSREEFTANTQGDRRFKLDSNRIYLFKVKEFDNPYDLHGFFAKPGQAFNSVDLSSVRCADSIYSTQVRNSDNVMAPKGILGHNCIWIDFDKLALYGLGIGQFFEGKTEADLENLDEATLLDFQNYADTVLNKYLEWYPPTLATPTESISV